MTKMKKAQWFLVLVSAFLGMNVACLAINAWGHDRWLVLMNVLGLFGGVIGLHFNGRTIGLFEAKKIFGMEE